MSECSTSLRQFKRVEDCTLYERRTTSQWLGAENLCDHCRKGTFGSCHHGSSNAVREISAAACRSLKRTDPGALVVGVFHAMLELRLANTATARAVPVVYGTRCCG